jgi:succinate dehydrogenase / fumarate reductase cytochrome b subunit
MAATRGRVPEPNLFRRAILIVKISSVYNRPVNLDIGTIQLPITAYVSITHRVTGVLLCAGLLFMLWMLALSLDSAAGFNQAQDILQSVLGKIATFLTLAPLTYHLVAGVRHLLMDFGVGESLEGGQLGAKIVFAVSIVLIFAMGGWLWSV